MKGLKLICEPLCKRVECPNVKPTRKRPAGFLVARIPITVLLVLRRRTRIIS
jgi:hypothetical protein